MKAAHGENPQGTKANALLIVLSTISVNLLSLALPIMTLQIYDRILPNPQSGTLSVLVAGVTIAIILEACLRLARAYMIGWNAAAFEYATSGAAMRHLLGANVSKIRSYGVGEHLHRMAAIGKLRDFHSGQTLSSFIDSMFIFVYAGFSFYVAGRLAVVPLSLLGVFAIISFAEGRGLQRRLKERETTDDNRYDFLIENLNAIHTIKAFSIENTVSRRYEQLQKNSVSANYDVAEATASIFNTGTVMAHVISAATITAGALFVLGGQVTTGALIALLLLAGRMMQSVQRGLVLWVRYQDYHISRARVGGIFSLPAVAPADKEPVVERTGRLSVKDIFFSFAEDEPPLLKGISFDLAPGDVMLLKGDNAAGKSTLLNLIAGVFPPQHGLISVDGHDLQDFPPAKLTRHTGYISNNPVIFRGTIRDNITRFGEIAEKDARDAAAALGVDKDVAQLPTGFDTVITGNNSDSIPPGLKQRLAMTRVLAAGPRILLFDQADQSLDRASYKLVLRLLTTLRDTTALILVTEDPDIISLATCQGILNGGTLTLIKMVHHDSDKQRHAS